MAIESGERIFPGVIEIWKPRAKIFFYNLEIVPGLAE